MGKVGIVSLICMTCERLSSGLYMQFRCGLIAGHVCTLEAFQDNYWKPFTVTEEERQEACTLTFEHEQPAGSGGDSLSGF